MQPARLEFTHRFIPGDGAFTLLLLHGTGGDETDLLPLARMLWPGARSLAVRGKVLENGMPRFFRRLGEGIFDTEDVKFRAHELADFLDSAAARYKFDPARVIAVGYSNGANIAAAVLLLRPAALAGAVLFRPMVPFEPEALPDLSGIAAFLAAGRTDPIVPAHHPERLARILQDAGAAVTLSWSPDGHQLSAHDVAAARTWLDQRGLAPQP